MVFCDDCTVHQCPGLGRPGQRTAKISVPMELSIILNIDQYLSYFCKNNKFGCEEVLVNQEKLLEHEKYCDFQVSRSFAKLVPGIYR